MKQQEKPETKDLTAIIRLRSSEKECPVCQAVLLHNNSEECYECLNCGYIDCGEE